MPSLDYIFKNDYSNLRKTNVDIRVTDYNDRETLSAYSGGLGTLTFTPKFLDVNLFPSNNNFIIDLGDGTVTRSLSTKHFYKNAGVYEVKIIVVDETGDMLRSSIVKKIKVNDIIPDTIYLTYGENYYSSIGYLSGTQPPSTMAQEFLVTRYNTAVSSKIINENDNKIILSVDDNETEFFNIEKYNNDRDFQLKKVTFFCDRKEKFKIIDSVSTSNTEIFAGVKINENSDNEIIVKPKELISDEEKKFTSLVGTSGTGMFYYYEDLNINIPLSVEGQITCLPQTNYFLYDNDRFYLNEISTFDLGVAQGNYLIKNIPKEYPLTILNDNNTSINILTGFGETYFGSKKVLNTENDAKYNFYYGDLIINVTGDFGFVSFYTFFNDFFGGKDLLRYKSSCKFNELESNILIQN